MKTRTRIRWGGGWAAAAAALLSAASAPGQASPDLAEFTARSITRLALLDIRLAPSPAPEDYRVASILLGMAQTIAPEDQEIIRRRMEAAWQAGDTDTVLELSRRLVELDPRDTVSQLRLITARVARLQNVEDRLALYDRFLNTRGDGRHLDPSIRSRLALDAALLLRDRGDEDGFVERLILATQLDSTHKEAALVALSYAADRVGVIDRLDLMANVLLADPVDPNVHEAIARQLAVGGAYEGARRFLDNARTIRRAAGQTVDSVDHAERMRRWHAEGPAAVVDEINRTLLMQKEEAARDLRDLVARGLPTDQARKPEEIRISPQFATVAALAFDALEDRPAVEAAVADLALTVNAIVTPLMNAATRPQDVTPEQADRQMADLLVTLGTARFWTGTQTEAAAVAFEPSSPLVRVAPPELPVLQAWLKLREGRAAEAAQALEELADSSPLARVAFAQACEQLGDVPEALEQYDLLVRDAPLDLYGAWARSRLARLGVALDPAQTERLERWARPDRSAGVPGWVDETARSPRTFINLRADLERNTLDGVERATLRLSITNQRDLPLALGPDRTINSRLLLAPKLDAPVGALAQLARPEVVDLDRRLRLMPRETLEVEVWPDPGETGLLLEMLALRTVRVRWRIIQGFWLSAAGGYEPGPMCLTTETPSLVRNSLPEASLNAGELARKVAADPEHLLPRAASALRTLLLMIAPQNNGDAPRRNDEAVSQVVGAWVARWPSLSPRARAMAAAVIPGRVFAEPLAALDDRIKADEDPVVLAVAIVTRVTDPGDEFLARMERSTDPRVAALARLVGARLAAGGNGYAHLSPARLWPDAEPPAP